MRAGIFISFGLWLAVAVYATGCAGVELGGKVGLYAVDERTERQETRSVAKPLRCIWNDCSDMGAK